MGSDVRVVFFASYVVSPVPAFLCLARRYPDPVPTTVPVPTPPPIEKPVPDPVDDRFLTLAPDHQHFFVQKCE